MVGACSRDALVLTVQLDEFRAVEEGAGPAYHIFLDQ
jgi:hypothetical protein